MKAFRRYSVLGAMLAALFTGSACTASDSVIGMSMPTSAPTEPALMNREGMSDIPSECRADSFGCARIPAGEMIRIGLAGPMTGDFSSFGIDAVQAGEIALADYGQYLSWRFELVAGDTQGDPALAVPLAESWVADPTLVGVAGHMFTGETATVIPIYDAAHVPMLSPTATGPGLTQMGSDVFNRVAFTDEAQGRFAAIYLHDLLNLSSIAVAHDGSPYGEALARIVARTFEAAGGRVAANLNLDADADGELDEFDLATWDSDEIEAVYYGGYDVGGAALLIAIREAGLDDAIFFGCDGTFGESFARLAGEAGEGAFAASPVPPVTEARLAFDQAYFDRFGVAPGTLSPFSWNSYDAVGALILTVKQVAVVGQDGALYVPRTALTRAVRNLKSYPGLTGYISCDVVGECATAGPSFYQLRDGNWGLPLSG